MRRIFLAAVLFSGVRLGATTYTSDGTQANIGALMAIATAGDTITLPAGSFPWTGHLDISKSITLSGAGIGQTFITLTAASPGDSPGVIGVTANNVTIRDFSVTVSADCGATVVSVSSNKTGIRITGIYYDCSSGGTGRILYGGNGSYGCVDHCTLLLGRGNQEYFFTRGPTDAWTTDPTMGTANAWYMENCTIAGANGYTDSNDYAKSVFRFNSITSQSKFDRHGSGSNSSHRSFRHIEVYENHYTNSGTNFNAIEFRGGTGMVFNNTSDFSSGTGVGTSPKLALRDYSVDGTLLGGIGINGVWQTPNNYPIPDQVGRGKNEGSEPLYAWGNRKANTLWDAAATSNVAAGSRTTNSAAYSIGDTVITFTSPPSPNLANNYITFAGDSNLYLVASQSGASITLTAPGLLQAIPASPVKGSYGPIQNYRAQQGNPAATFTMNDIIQADRDYFREVSGFTGASGVGIGTKAAMLAITPTKTGVGFWVTDEGSWNTTLPANTSGQLYTWNGSAWVLKYTPYTYPHPLDSDGPDTTPPTAVASTNSAGTQLNLAMSEICITGPSGPNGVTLVASGGAVTATYSHGSSSATWVYDLSRSVGGTEIITWSYSTVAGIRDQAGNDLAPVVNGSVTNNVQPSVSGARHGGKFKMGGTAQTQ